MKKSEAEKLILSTTNLSVLATVEGLIKKITSLSFHEFKSQYGSDCETLGEERGFNVYNAIIRCFLSLQCLVNISEKQDLATIIKEIESRLNRIFEENNPDVYKFCAMAKDIFNKVSVLSLHHQTHIDIISNALEGYSKQQELLVSQQKRMEFGLGYLLGRMGFSSRNNKDNGLTQRLIEKQEDHFTPILSLGDS